MMILEALTLIFSILGSYLLSKHDARRANAAFALANVTGALYFALTRQWAYVVQQFLFLGFSIRGLRKRYLNNLQDII